MRRRHGADCPRTRGRRGLQRFNAGAPLSPPRRRRIGRPRPERS